MTIAALVVTIIATLISAFSAFVAWKQRGDASTSATAAEESARAAGKAAERVAEAQERIAAGLDAERRRANDSQAKRVRLRVSQQHGGRGRVKVTNSSDAPIFDVHIHSITALIDSVETSIPWRPNPYTHPVIERIDRIDGGGSRELYPFFGEDWPGHQWSPIVRFLDADRKQWEINLDSEVVRVEE